MSTSAKHESVVVSFGAHEVVLDAGRALSRGVVAWGTLGALLAILVVGVNRAIEGVADALEITTPTLAEAIALPARIPFAAVMFAIGAAGALEALHGRTPSARGIVGALLVDRAAPIRVSIVYLASLIFGVMMCVVPGIVVLARRFVAVAVALDEHAPHSTAWERSRTLASPRPVTAVMLGTVGVALGFGINFLWAAGDPWASRTDDPGTWLLFACIHQWLQLARFAVDGALAAALYRRLLPDVGVDAPSIASVFE